MRIAIRQDGRAELTRGDTKLLSFLPGMDCQPLSHREGNSYGAQEGTVTLRAGALSPDHAALILDFRAPGDLPNAVQPVCAGVMDGLRGAFRQGFGLGGPSGYLSAAEIGRDEPFFSYGVVALRVEDGYVVLFAGEVGKYTLQFHVARLHARLDGWQLTASFLTEGVRAEDEGLSVHALFSATLEGGLKQAAAHIAERGGAQVREPAYHWCSWYYYYNDLDHRQLTGLLQGMAGLSPRLPVRYVQIDAGYFPSAGDWLEPFHRFPKGLEAAFAEIADAGYAPGIWIAPFMIGSRSGLFARRPDWALKKRDGSYVTPWRMYNEPKVWGYQDEEYYVLDTSHPEALEYIVSVFSTLRKWGARFFKTDFMLWGIQPSNEVLRHTPGKTSVEHYRELMGRIRLAIGDSYWLGCIAPFLPMLGFANGMRIAGDVGAEWAESGFGPSNLLEEIAADNYFNGVYWQNDPDAILLRDYHIFLKEHEVESLALLQAVSGGAVYTSETMHLLPERRLDLFRFLEPDAVRRAETPFLDQREKAVAFVQRMGARRLIYLLNPSAEPLDFCYDIRALTGDEALYLRVYQEDDWAREKAALIFGRIAPHACRLYFGHTDRPVDRKPTNLWKWGE